MEEHGQLRHMNMKAILHHTFGLLVVSATVTQGDEPIPFPLEVVLSTPAKEEVSADTHGTSDVFLLDQNWAIASVHSLTESSSSEFASVPPLCGIAAVHVDSDRRAFLKANVPLLRIFAYSHDTCGAVVKNGDGQSLLVWNLPHGTVRFIERWPAEDSMSGAFDFSSIRCEWVEIDDKKNSHSCLVSLATEQDGFLLRDAPGDQLAWQVGIEGGYLSYSPIVRANRFPNPKNALFLPRVEINEIAPESRFTWVSLHQSRRPESGTLNDLLDLADSDRCVVSEVSVISAFNSASQQVVVLVRTNTGIRFYKPRQEEHRFLARGFADSSQLDLAESYDMTNCLVSPNGEMIAVRSQDHLAVVHLASGGTRVRIQDVRRGSWLSRLVGWADMDLLLLEDQNELMFVRVGASSKVEQISWFGDE